MKENVTLSNACFRYDGSKEAKECIKLLNEQFEGYFNNEPFTPSENDLISIHDGYRRIHDHIPFRYNLISPSDYLSLLTPQQPERLLTEADLVMPHCKCETPKYSDNKVWCMNCKLSFKDENIYHMKELNSQTAQEEVKGEEDKDLAVELIARFNGTYGRNNQWGERIKAAFVDGVFWKEKKYHQKTSLLQQEVEKLRELPLLFGKFIMDYFIIDKGKYVFQYEDSALNRYGVQFNIQQLMDIYLSEDLKKHYYIN